MTFKEWWEKEGQFLDSERVDFCKTIWNAAIEQAAQLVEDNFDIGEPWIRPSDINELKEE